MDNEKLLSAYHESARVVFAYINGFACDAMELAAKNAITNSKLNAGSDIKFVQAVLAGTANLLQPEELPHGIEVAKKLMAIYCAGTCAEIYMENNLSIPDELEMDIQGQDLSMIEKTQSFLQKAIENHSTDFPTETIAAIFKKLRTPDVWKPIQALTDKFIEQDFKLSRFQIEDTLMSVGMNVRKATTKSGFNLDVHEDDEETSEANIQTEGLAFDSEELTPIDVMVKEFLRKIKTNWSDAELESAVEYLHKIYKKYGQH